MSHWTTAIQDLRIRLSDGPTDRLHWRKKCFGQSNGTNLNFKTFEFRRVTNFTTQGIVDQVTGVYVGGALQPPTSIVYDNLQVGEFQLLIPPPEAVEVEATYYTQWFYDAELIDLTEQATLLILSTKEYLNVPPGLVPAVVEMAASRAYSKMASRWREYMATTYKLENDPTPNPSSPVASFISMANDAKEEALNLVKFYYTRQGQNLQPLFGQVIGHVRNMP